MRYKELDALRGLAALTVVINHFLNVFPFIPAVTYDQGLKSINILKYSPLHIFWAGHEAVILFFTLSGFVLSLPFFSGGVKYKTFIIKRICRIYIPYICAVLFSLLTFELFSTRGISQLSKWFNVSWVLPITSKDLISHFILIGYFNTDKLDNAIWSLVHEMRISLIFPLLIFLILRVDWKINLPVAAILSYMSFKYSYFITPTPMLNNLALSFHYMFMFVVGAALAQHRDNLVYNFKKLSVYLKIALIFLAIFCYTYSWEFYGYTRIHKPYFNDWIITIGASIFIITILSYNKYLMIKPVQHLGKISYSLYLFHLPALLSTVYLLYGKFPLWGILIIAFFAALIIAKLSYRFIEAPSVALGRLLTKGKGSSVGHRQAA